MPRPPKLLVLILDAASPELLESWGADGTLPAIGALMRDGVVARTGAMDGFYVGSTWLSFYTATTPATHGIYWLDRLRVGSYRTVPVAPDDFARHQSLWEAVSKQGRRVLVADVPLTNLAPDLDGVQVVEWRSHDPLFGFRTRPPELRDEILRSVGEHPSPLSCDKQGRSVAEYRTFADQLVAGAAVRGRLTRQLLARHPWDLAIQVFNESHCGGHQLWHFHDPRCPAYDAATTAAHGDMIRDVYQAIDRAVGEIVAAVEPGTTVALMSLHGMSYMAGTANLLPEVLLRLGVMARPSHRDLPPPATARERLVRTARSAYHAIPEKIRLPFYQFRQRLASRITDHGTPIAIDPQRTRCFTVPTGALTCGIRLNLRGREPAGILDRGAAADRFCDELTGELMQLTDADTGRPLVARVLRTARLYHGPELDLLPDLVVEWHLDRPNGSATVGSGRGATVRARSERIGVVEAVNDYARSGDHRPGGILVARGDGIPPGRFARTVPLPDLAPTLARFVGCTMPGAEGRPVAGLLDAGER